MLQESEKAGKMLSVFNQYVRSKVEDHFLT